MSRFQRKRRSLPIFAIIWAESAATGRSEMSSFHGLSLGKICSLETTASASGVLNRIGWALGLGGAGGATWAGGFAGAGSGGESQETARIDSTAAKATRFMGTLPRRLSRSGLGFKRG